MTWRKMPTAYLLKKGTQEVILFAHKELNFLIF